jgi:hypothetical protein
LQHLESTSARRDLTNCIPRRTSQQTLQRAVALEPYGITSTELIQQKPRRRHRVTHPTTHHSKPRQVRGVRHFGNPEHVRHDDVVEKARDGFARGSFRAQDITVVTIPFARARCHTVRRLGCHRARCRASEVDGGGESVDGKEEKKGHLAETRRTHYAQPTSTHAGGFKRCHFATRQAKFHSGAKTAQQPKWPGNESAVTFAGAGTRRAP